MKVRVFKLAKDIGIDSKELIKHCNDAGVKVKASALASISPEERDIVLEYLKKLEPAKSDSSVEAPLSPMREAARAGGGKIRAIKAMAPRSQQSLRRRAAETKDAESELPEGSAATQSPELEADITTDESDVVVADEEPKLGESDTKKVSMSRDDYVPASGAGGSTIREMKPRGTASEEETREKRSKGKSKPALPSVAAPPAYKLPKTKTAKAESERAQKPDLKLTPEALEQQSPLGARMKKHAEQRKPVDENVQKTKGKRDGERTGTGTGLGLIEARQQRRERRRQTQPGTDEGSRRGSRTRGPRRRRQRTVAPADLKTEAQVEFPMTVRALSEAMGRPAKALLQILFDQGMMVSINEIINEETALELALELGVDLTIKRERDIEQELLQSFEEEESPEDLESRPPIVTILGHVDHGKTSLLDKIRSANVVEGEAGGITQHIAAYQVEHDGNKVTFVDTPGHAAFGEMRARGANVTDIVVLVVAADDGVMPQTQESISHAKAAGVPIVVAMNKIDLPSVDEQKVLQGLSTHDVLPAEWGGDVEVIRTSAETGQGVDDLLDTILTISELHEFKTNANRPAVGVCLEAFRDEGRGVLAWFIIQKGTLRVGDVVLCGSTYGRIRAMYNDRDEELTEAPASMPVKVAGLDMVPDAGDHFFVLSDIEESREAAEARRHRGRTESLSGRGQPRTLEDILDAARGGEVQDLPLILKADSPGSIEALKGEIEKFEHPEVRVNILHTGVGGVNESDVSLASASGAIVIAFHVVPEDRAVILADREGVDIRRYRIIYEITDQIKSLLEGLLKPERLEVLTGRALVLQTFHISRFGTIAGCRILNGTIERANRVHVIRDQTVLNSYSIASLKREKDDAKEVREGMECGIRLEGFNDVKEGDIFEAFRIEMKDRTLD